MDSTVVVALVVVVALAVWIASRMTRAPADEPTSPTPPKAHPPEVAVERPRASSVSASTDPASKSGVSTTTHDLGGGAVLHRIAIDRFAIAPSELHPADDDVPAHRELAYQLADELLALDDPDEDGERSPGGAIALVSPRGLGGSTIATLALSERRYDAGAVTLELGASGPAPMDPDVARSHFVHLFEMEARLSVEQVRERYLALLARPIALHLRDASRAHVDALVPAARARDGAHVVVTTATPLARADILERAVPVLEETAVHDALAQAGAPDAGALVPHVAGHPTALGLVVRNVRDRGRRGLAPDARAFADALEAASGAGLPRVLAATLATLDPELAAMARALAILPTSFGLPAAMVIGRGRDERTTLERLARLVDSGILAPACADKMNRERAEVRPALRSLLRAGADDLAERGLVLEMANRLVELEDLFLAGPTKRAPALYLVGLEWPSFDLARTIARARASDHPTFATGAEIFETAAPRLFGERPAMARAWGRTER